MSLKASVRTYIFAAAVLTTLSPGAIAKGPSAGHASHSSASKSEAPKPEPTHHVGYRGRGHRGYPYYGNAEDESLPPVSNQMAMYNAQADATRASLPRSAFVQEYSWPSSPSSSVQNASYGANLQTRQTPSANAENQQLEASASASPRRVNY